MNGIRFLTRALLLLSLFYLLPATAHAKGGDFDAVVRNVKVTCGGKRVRIPFLGLAGFATKLVRPAGVKSFKLAVFEDQNFAGDFTKFRTSLNDALNVTWMPLIQTLSAKNEEQVYIFLKSTGEKYDVLVVTIEQRDATVVQVTLSSKNLAILLRDPEGTGKAITEEATISDPE